MWLEPDNENEESDIAYMCATDLQSIVVSLSNNVFQHGHHSFTACAPGRIQFDSDRTAAFKGVVIETAANRRSIMSLAQYRAHEREFGRKFPLTPPDKDARGIGGRSKSLGEVFIQVPSVDLNLIIGVKFSILQDDLPSLLSNKDLLDNGLDTSLQEAFLFINDRQKSLILYNYFFIHRWNSSSIPNFMYTEGEIRTIHRSCGHPSVKSLTNQFSKAAGKSLETHARKELQNITDD